jgi:A/G-specific adenine glycosylase
VRDPYAIWVAEVMLQQTQVASVIPFYQRFLDRFPTVQALAAANLSDVLRLWAGLGYYHRARHLHAAAQILVKDFSGTLPPLPEDFAQLPGVGRYTLGAVYSQAFDCRLPVVDGNVQRVLARLSCCTVPLSDAKARAWLWQYAAALLPRKRVGTFNQALMELGQTVCTPIEPNCELCPLKTNCLAFESGMEKCLPRLAPRPKPTPVSEVAVLAQRAGRFLVVQRPDHGRWPNFWEFPHAPLEPGEKAFDAACRLFRSVTGLCARSLYSLGSITYRVTRFQVCLEAVLLRAGSGQARGTTGHRWLTLGEMGQLPLARPQQRLRSLALRWLEDKKKPKAEPWVPAPELS